MPQRVYASATSSSFIPLWKGKLEEECISSAAKLRYKYACTKLLENHHCSLGSYKVPPLSPTYSAASTFLEKYHAIKLTSSQAKTISNKATQLSVTESQDQGAVEHSADQPRS